MGGEKVLYRENAPPSSIGKDNGFSSREGGFNSRWGRQHNMEPMIIRQSQMRILRRRFISTTALDRYYMELMEEMMVFLGVKYPPASVVFCLEVWHPVIPRKSFACEVLIVTNEKVVQSVRVSKKDLDIMRKMW